MPILFLYVLMTEQGTKAGKDIVALLTSDLSPIQTVLFQSEAAEEQQLATATCPDFSTALKKAEVYAYEEQRCRGCRGKQVTVIYEPFVCRVKIQGTCPQR